MMGDFKVAFGTNFDLMLAINNILFTPYAQSLMYFTLLTIFKTKVQSKLHRQLYLMIFIYC